MARIYLVRHGEAAARWGEDADPGLSEAGRVQAAAVAGELAPLGPLPLVASPLRRARETAVPLAQAWSCDAMVEPAVAEVPAPDIPLGERQGWLRRIMAGTWADADGRGETQLRPWRDGIMTRLQAMTRDTVVVSHFIVINVAVGAATNDDRVVVFRPGYCSVTVLDCDGAGLRLVNLGAEAETVVR